MFFNPDEMNNTAEHQGWKWAAIWNVSNDHFGLSADQERETMFISLRLCLEMEIIYSMDENHISTLKKLHIWVSSYHRKTEINVWNMFVVVYICMYIHNNKQMKLIAKDKTKSKRENFLVYKHYGLAWFVWVCTR